MWQDKVDPRKLKPVKGETVMFNGEKYTVFAVGMKYAVLHKPGGKTRCLAKFSQVQKMYDKKEIDNDTED